MHQPPPPPPRIDPALQAFLGDHKTELGLHPQEQALLVIAGTHLCFTPWALGSMHAWSQLISLVLAAAGFALALVNRHYTGELARGDAFKLIMWPKLVRFPVFWLGLALLGYIAIQALNPAWIYAANGGYLWVVPLEHVSWLPSGVEAPFGQMNAWRALVIYGSAWLLVCALWVGVTRRATIQYLFTIVVANGALLSLLGILQRVTETYGIFWMINRKVGFSFFATFIYKNHAGAYFNLVVMLCAAMAYWHFARGERRMARSNPAPFFAFSSILLGISVLLSDSRAATMLLVGFAIVAFIGFILHFNVSHAEGRNPLIIVALCAIFISFLSLGVYFLRLDTTFERVGKLMGTSSTDSSINARASARQASWEMARDNPVTGWGAGSFRYIFPTYQAKHPDIYHVPDRPNARYFWQYAHNDYLQLLDEVGGIGATLVLAMLGFGMRHLFQNHAHRRLHFVLIMLALAITLIHCWVDFQFHNPAILLLWCAMAVLVCRWSEMEGRRA